MKKHVIFAAMLLVSVSMAMTGCKGQAKKEKVEATERYDLGELGDEVIKLVKALPEQLNPKAAPKYLSEAGITYIEDIVVTQSSYEKMLTMPQKAFGAGAVLTDILYALVTERTDEAGRFAAYGRALIADLGFGEELTDEKEHKYIKMAEKLMSNKDSLSIGIQRYIAKMHNVMSNSNEIDIYAYVLIATNIEWEYILSQVTSLTADNEKLLEIENIQKQKMIHVFNIVELMKNDPNVAPLYEDFKPIMKIYEAEPTITKENIGRIAAAYKKLRSHTIQ